MVPEALFEINLVLPLFGYTWSDTDFRILILDTFKFCFWQSNSIEILDFPKSMSPPRNDSEKHSATTKLV